MKSILVTMLTLTVFFGYSVYATSFDVNKSSYQQGDDILLTGSVSPVQPGSLISIQILNPSSTDLVQVDMFLPNSDGSFSKIYKADGPKWAANGKYTLKLFYNDKEYQKTFQYNNAVESKVTEKPKVGTISDPKDSTKPEEKTSTDSEKKQLQTIETKQKPKTHIPGFPALDKSPQYYIDRYETEQNYKEWFDSQFPGKTIEEVVGYKSTHISNFPDEHNSPAYYIDRYETEQNYKEWFDSQFPGKTIYQILGFPDPLPVPEWIKNNAGWWSRGQISDDDFISGIQYMIENNIMIIPDIPETSDSNLQEVPNWVRNNANWWALDKISEEEFLNAIKYLIENGVIPIN